ncbi:unnamed protein product, partial [Brachionus calyciflorus]
IAYERASKKLQNDTLKIYSANLKNDIKTSINLLKKGKSIGFDNVSNELLFYGNNEKIRLILSCIFNTMIKYGYTPDNFNVDLATPIPKKGQMKEPSDLRPISVSTSYANLFQSLLLKKTPFENLISKNQFGDRAKTSCKHAYFMVNETINYFRNGKSELKLISLDATKAFDKLWRQGIF